MISRISAVTSVAATGNVSASVYRTPLIPAVNTNGLAVYAATTDLLPVVGSSVVQGQFLNDATARLPVAVLGAAAARRTGRRPGRRGDRRPPPGHPRRQIVTDRGTLDHLART